METLRYKWENLPLRKCFLYTLIGSVFLALALSALIFFSCHIFQTWLFPQSNGLYLTIEKTNSDGTMSNTMYYLEEGADLTNFPSLSMNEAANQSKHEISTKYAIKKIEQSFDTLSSKRKLAYRLCQGVMVIAPALLMVLALIFCTMLIYRKKLKQPLFLLEQAAANITAQNLDFAIVYENQDELGDLCKSFEQMRKALYENNQTLWKMLEERKLYQASIAHDLRNPITIIKGYSEYLKSGIKTHDRDKEKICHIVEQMDQDSSRLAQYNEMVHTLNIAEEMSIQKHPFHALRLLKPMMDDFQLLCEHKHIDFQITDVLADMEILVDEVLLQRILENVMDNALRNAQTSIQIKSTLHDHQLVITIQDDGKAFPAHMRRSTVLFYDENNRIGIGLAISRMLCKKHGGDLKIYNSAFGACVEILLAV